MLNINQEKVLTISFVAILTLIGITVILERNVIDIIYFAIICCCFIKFLMIKYGR